MPRALRTPLCDLLGLDTPICGLTHSVAASAAISRCGGFGVYAATRDTPEEIVARGRELQRSAGGRPTGIDILLPKIEVAHSDRAAVEAAIPEGHRRFVARLREKYAVPPASRPGYRNRQVRSRDLWERQIEAVLDTDTEVFACGVGVSADVVRRARARGKLTLAVVGAPRHAAKALECGVDILVVQGYDGGGHTGTIGTMALLPQVCAMAGRTPVLAAGGIATGGQMVAALAMGAQGIWMGTVWLTAREHALPEPYVAQLLAAGSGDTVVTRASSGKPMRQIRTAWSDEWSAPDAPEPLKMPYQDLLVGDIVQAAEENGITALMHQPAGQSVAWCRDRTTVAEILDRIEAEAEAALHALDRLRPRPAAGPAPATSGGEARDAS